ncbi:hypothetical protein [Macrococcoides caseolyticum]|uniref:hypothetical protein n=1 Tax=Macrococcoides caseolyticum TaxID=69966 RepID=UPI0012FF46AD|nr:hypothetical protein [Macrococcus caseolyticus]QPT47674.1 hypothetical protein I6G25_05335 [Macrococcus caseolyticus]QYA35967.1 hypothetical protein KYI08_03580 [Macrococcus caseolyticus]
MADFLVKKPVNLNKEGVKLTVGDIVELTVKRAEEIQEEILKQKGYEKYTDVFERIDKK